MRTSFLVSALALFSSAVAQFDPDQCGPQAGNQKCSGSKCCSKYGWCGTSNAYCRVSLGCQPGFGTCSGVSSSSATATQPTPSLSVPVGTSTDKCGSANGLICAAGYCCSQYGYCGRSTTYCSVGCQLSFGTCSAASGSSTRSSSARSSSATPSASSALVSKNGRCGSSFSGQTCQGSTFGNCCSKYNYCGSTNDHCKIASGCQSGFGTCSGIISSSSVVRSFSSSGSRVVASSTSVSSTSSLSSSIPAAGASSASPSTSSSSFIGSSSSMSSSSSNVNTPSPSISSPAASPSSSTSTDVLSTSTSLSSSDSNARSASSSSSVLSSSSASSTPSRSSTAVQSTDASQSSTASSSSLINSPSSSAAFSSTVTSGAAPSSSIGTSTSSTSNAVSSSGSVSTLASSSAISTSIASPSASDPSITSSSFATSDVVASSTQSSPSASSTPPPTSFSNDPLSDPAAITIEKSANIQESVVNDPAGAPPGSSGSYLTLVTTDGNGASMKVTTQAPSLQSGTRYTVSVWLKSASSASTCSVDIVVGADTIGTSGSPIPTTWTQYSASYLASGNSSPTLSLAITCPVATTIIDARRVKSKRDTGSGLSMGSLTMTQSTDTTPTGCIPNIIDGGFEKFTSSGSDDWTTATGAIAEWNGNANIGPAYAGPVNSTYNALTSNPSATSYDIKYKHPLTLCAGIAYDISGWGRTQQASRQAYNQEGCTLSAFLNGQQAWTDRIGYYDYPQYRYLHGTVTPSADTSTAELFFRVDCKVPQYSKSTKARGIKLDQVAVVPASQWTLPPAAKPTPVTVVATTLQTVFPTPTLCYPTTITYPRTGCVTEFEQFPNGGFELCADKEWWIQNATSGYGYYSETFPFNRTTTISVSDDVVSGTNALRLVLNDEVTDNHARLISYRSPTFCVERSYAWSFWVKQGKNLACTVSITIGNAVQGTWTPTQQWQKFEGRIDVSPVGTLKTSGYTYLSIDCKSGGMDGAVWFDDISLKQVPYQGS